MAEEQLASLSLSDAPNRYVFLQIKTCMNRKAIRENTHIRLRFRGPFSLLRLRSGGLHCRGNSIPPMRLQQLGRHCHGDHFGFFSRDAWNANGADDVIKFPF